MPIVTLGELGKTPAAEALVEIETPVSISVTTIARFQVAKPVTCNVDEGCNGATQDARSHQNDPDLTGIGQLLHMSQDPACTRIEISQPLAFFCVLEDPIDGGEIVIAYASPGPFDVPIQPSRILGVLQTLASVTGRVEVVEDAFRRVVCAGRAIAQLLQAGIGRAWERRCATGRGKWGGGQEAREAEGACSCCRFPLKGYPAHV